MRAFTWLPSETRPARQDVSCLASWRSDVGYSSLRLQPRAQPQRHHILIVVAVELGRCAMDELINGADIEVRRREVRRADPEGDVLLVGSPRRGRQRRVVGDGIVAVPVELQVGEHQIAYN